LINLENTKWLQYISGLLKASLLVVNAIDKDRKSVLVHCSDGWDRTPQIVALAELLLDPYYRTVEVGLTAVPLCNFDVYRPRSRGDNTFGSVRVCVSVRLSMGALLFELFDL